MSVLFGDLSRSFCFHWLIECLLHPIRNMGVALTSDTEENAEEPAGRPGMTIGTNDDCELAIEDQSYMRGLAPVRVLLEARSALSSTAAITSMSEKDEDGGGDDADGKTGVVTKTRPKTKKPNLYKVLLLNDDYTPMEFVIHVLEKYFNKGREDATRIMLQVHQKGVGICGVYTYEVAETKVTQVIDFSRQHGHPLQCTMEKE